MTAVAVLVACTPPSNDAAPAGSSAAPHPTSSEATSGVSTYVTAGARLGLGGCALFPTDDVFHASIGRLAVLAGSAATISAMGPATVIKAGFGAGIWQGSRLGIPTNLTDSRVAPKHFVAVADWAVDSSENAAVPWPAAPRIEGWPGRAWDAHMVTVDSARCESWEMINVMEPGANVLAAVLHPGSWYADRVVRRSLSSNAMPERGSASASGLSLLAGLVRYDEVASGRVDHVLTMAFPRISALPARWPASGTDGKVGDPAAVRMGSLLRLRGDVDISGLGPQAKVVAQAMKDHGVVISDTGPNAALTGEPDVRWDDSDLDGLGRLTVGDFDVVDAAPMQVSAGSYQIR